MAESRTVEARKRDVLAALDGQHDLWLATADRSGRPHLIAVSAWWDGKDLVIATRVSSRTAKNLSAGQNVRLAGGSPGDGLGSAGGGNGLGFLPPASEQDPGLSRI